MSKAVAEHYPELDKDLLMAGAFLHDMGKMRELKFDKVIDYTDEGRLLGHLILGPPR
jgi:3'-5' exoribonuclease